MRNPYLPRGVQPIGQAYAGAHALGDAPAAPRSAGGMRPAPQPKVDYDPWSQFEQIPAFYTVSITLDGTVGATQSGSTQLRPEPFVCRRITWAATGDCPSYLNSDPAYSVQGRSVTVEWDDEFTKFLGNTQCLISALFGDSQGFLDIPRGALFQGKQSLTVKLTRLFWPGTTPVSTRFDFVFAGVGLLPKGVAQSGSAG